jgi:hypothetical protein
MMNAGLGLIRSRLVPWLPTLWFALFNSPLEKNDRIEMKGLMTSLNQAVSVWVPSLKQSCVSFKSQFVEDSVFHNSVVVIRDRKHSRWMLLSALAVGMRNARWECAH